MFSRNSLGPYVIRGVVKLNRVYRPLPGPHEARGGGVPLLSYQDIRHYVVTANKIREELTKTVSNQAFFSLLRQCVVCQNGMESVRWYKCCPPPPPDNRCPPSSPGHGRRVVPPVTCKQRINTPNPCCPVYHQGKHARKYKLLFFFFFFPLIIVQAIRAFSGELPEKGPCRQYEYMRIRSKRFPWGDGNKSFFHNDHVNHLPEECEPPPLICDDE